MARYFAKPRLYRDHAIGSVNDLNRAVHLSQNIPFLLLEKRRDFYCRQSIFETMTPIGANIRRQNCQIGGKSFSAGFDLTIVRRCAPRGVRSYNWRPAHENFFLTRDL
jgi:hypothetical protein